MRSEEQIYDTVLNYARADERIRMVTLEGSRANVNIPPDDFQDFDITFFVTDMESFTGDDEWLNVFGERLIMQKPEDMELFPAEETGFSYLMLFSDDVKIDLTLLPLDWMEEYFKRDKLVTPVYRFYFSCIRCNTQRSSLLNKALDFTVVSSESAKLAINTCSRIFSLIEKRNSCAL